MVRVAFEVRVMVKVGSRVRVLCVCEPYFVPNALNM